MIYLWSMAMVFGLISLLILLVMAYIMGWEDGLFSTVIVMTGAGGATTYSPTHPE